MSYVKRLFVWFIIPMIVAGWLVSDKVLGQEDLRINLNENLTKEIPFLPVVIGEGRDPYVSFGPQGQVYVVYATNSAIYFTKAAKVGAPFSEPVEVARVKGIVSKFRRGPRIAAIGNTIIITGVACGERIVIQAWRSEDGGRSWGGPISVNSQRASNAEGMYDLTGSADGSFHVVWLDNRREKKKMDIWAASSLDGGRSWKEAKVYQSPSGTVCECCWPAITVDPQGQLHILFRNFREGTRDMHIVTSIDGGKTWGNVKKLGIESWKLDICPGAGGSVAVTSEGRPVAIWSRYGKLFLSEIFEQEKPLGYGKMPSIAVGPQGVYAIWQRDGHIVVKTPHRNEGRTLTLRGHNPVVSGNPRTGVVATWEWENTIYLAGLSQGKDNQQ